MREICRGVRSGKLESHVSSVMSSCLKLELELYERFEVGAKLAKFDVEVAQLEARYAELRGRTPPARVR